MRVLFLSPVGTLGGAERVLLTVMAAVRASRPDADLHLLALADGPLLERARGLGVKTLLLPMPLGLNALGDSQLTRGGSVRKWATVGCQVMRAAPAAWRYLRQLRAQIEAIAPTLIHSNGIKTHLLLRLACNRGRPIIWHIHDFYGARPIARQLLPWAARGVAGAVAISQAVANDLAQALPRLTVRVVPNAIDVTTFAPSAISGEWLEVAAGLPPAPAGVVRVGLVATYARWKGQDLFLEAIARMPAVSVPVRFYVIGGPIYGTQGSQFSKEELGTLVLERSLADRVGLLGFQQDPAPVFQALDVVVHASTRPEPFGLTIVEGMACGRAVIVAAAGGAVELFQHDYDALGFASGDATALAAAIGTLVSDPARRQRLGAQARATVVERFNTDNLGAKILMAYRELLASSCSKTVEQVLGVASR